MPEADIERYVEARYPRPEPPEIWPENAPHLAAFVALSGSRASGFGVGPIPVSEIGAYWDRAGVGDFETFLGRVQAADDAFLRVHRDTKGRPR